MKSLPASVVAALAVAFAQSLFGSVLLSDNVPGGDYPGTVPALATGSTYTWGTNSAAGDGPGNTDADTVSQDLSFTKMTDGIDAAGGGDFATFSTYDGTVGQSSIFNLQSTYQIDYVTLSAQFNSVDSASGVGIFEAFTSTDGVNFTLFGRWDTAAPADGRSDVLTITPTSPVDAQYVMFYTNRYAGFAGEPTLPGQSVYHQVILGEQAIFGSAVPEPGTWALVTCGLIFCTCLRKRK